MKKLSCSVLRVSLVLVCAVGAGCTVGPKYSRPETAAETAKGYQRAGSHDQKPSDFNDIDTWWERFADPPTVLLVREALANNYDLKAAAARVLQAHAALAEAHGRQLPEVSYDISRARNKMSFNLGGGPFGGGRFTVLNTTWSQDISVAYMLDLFGQLKHAERAAWAQLLATGAAEQALTNSLIAGVVGARINIATLQRQLAIARANTENERKTLEIVERRYQQGLVGPVDLRLARENLASSQAVEPVIELSLIKARNALDVLLARPPGSGQDLPQTLDELPDLEPLPIGVPAALLDRRPDVQAAELALRSANEMVGVSISQMYPNLTLTAAYGASADTWEDIWKQYSETYSLITGLTQPIFRGGQIRAQIKAAKARYEELAANYANTVLTAMREVEDALAGEQMLQKQLGYAQRRLEEAKAAEELSVQRYQQGITGILTVLASEQVRRAAEQELAVLKGQIWTTRVNLYLALGGDWEDKDKVVAAKKDES